MDLWKKFENVDSIIIYGVLIIMLVIPSSMITKAYYSGLIPIVTFLVLRYVSGENIILLLDLATKKEKVCACLLSGVFLVLLPVSDIWNAAVFGTIWGKTIGYVYILVLVQTLLWICLKFLFTVKAIDEKIPIDRGKGKYFTGFYEYKSYFILLAFVSVLFIASCYPGLLHGDGWNVWQRVIGNERWYDWHPIGYIFFCWICSLIWKNPFSTIIVQTCIWIYVNLFIFSFIHKYISRRSCKLYLSATMIFMFSYQYLHVFYKDTIFSICFLGFTITLIAYVKGEKNNLIFAQLVLFGALAALTRHMMLIPILAGLLGGIIFWGFYKRQKNMVWTTVMVILCIVCIYTGSREVLFRVTNAERNPNYVKYSVALQMVAAYAANGDVDDDSKMFMENYMELRRWAEAYEQDPYKSDTISREAYGFLNAEQLNKIGSQGKDIFAVNGRFLLRHPINYIKALSKQASLTWRISEPNDYSVSVVNRFINAEEIVNERNPELNPRRNYLTELLEPIVTMSFAIPVWRNLAYHAGFSVYILLMCLLCSIYKKRWEYVIGMIPVIALDCMLFVSLPQQDSRYILPVIQIGTLYIGIWGESFYRMFRPVAYKDQNRRKDDFSYKLCK